MSSSATAADLDVELVDRAAPRAAPLGLAALGAIRITAISPSRGSTVPTASQMKNELPSPCR